MTTSPYPVDTTPDQRTRLDTALALLTMHDTVPHHLRQTLLDVLTPVCGDQRYRAEQLLEVFRRTDEDEDLVDVWGRLRNKWAEQDARVRIDLELTSGDYVHLEEVPVGWVLQVNDRNATTHAALTNEEMAELVRRYTDRESTPGT